MAGQTRRCKRVDYQSSRDYIKDSGNEKWKLLGECRWLFPNKAFIGRPWLLQSASLLLNQVEIYVKTTKSELK